MTQIDLLIFVSGAIIGSFLNVCIYRIPRGESVVSPRSRCPSCRRPLLWRHMIPVLSYLFLRGRCAWCRARISPMYPAVELLAGIVLLLLHLKYGLSLEFYSFAALACVLIVIVCIDFRTLRIPNTLVMAGLLIWLAQSVWAQSNLWDSFLAALLGSGSLFVIAVLGELLLKKPSMGAGDIKLAGVIGLFLGVEGTAFALSSAILIGGAVGVAGLISGRLSRSSQLPFGVFLALGTFCQMVITNGIGLVYWIVFR